MKKSSRARRMARHHGKHKAVATLNLTSLMDIFTILLIFLLVNNNNAAKLPDNQDIQLPESIAQELPTEVLTIQVSPVDIIVEGQKNRRYRNSQKSGRAYRGGAGGRIEFPRVTRAGDQSGRRPGNNDSCRPLGTLLGDQEVDA